MINIFKAINSIIKRLFILILIYLGSTSDLEIHSLFKFPRI